ncbi:hypothetical protein ACN2CC_24270 [Mesorhizobium muleiense]|uniref:hypothetical protein n=1 Tax=Mesorhizobium TaxID=68287 RepID=UPI0004BB53D9|nr:hypothetical protein [Mesorhizobium sp.]
MFCRSQLISLLKSRPKLVAVVTRSVEAVTVCQAGAVEGFQCALDIDTGVHR